MYRERVSEKSNSLSVIIPTFNEAKNIPQLITHLDRVRMEHELDLEVLIMDDDSRDGTSELEARLPSSWVRLIVRENDHGLSQAVLEGFRLATKDVLLVMDADLSHPAGAIPDMLRALDKGADIVVGSRYAHGGSTDEGWGFLRWLNSRIATLLARPFTDIRDPMSGFFALRRATLNQAAPLNPIGYKIGLELIVKCGCKNVKEIPIQFNRRLYGLSKLNFRQRILYLRHLYRLWVFRLGKKSDRTSV